MAVKQVEEHSTFHNKIIGTALLESVRKLNPLVMKSNPVLFVVEMGTVLILLMILFPHYFGTENQIGWNTGVFLVLLLPSCLPILPKHWQKGGEKRRQIRCAGPKEILRRNG
ncbi:high-affinity K+ transport system ATPase subunit B [Brevibacillus sp. 1238]|jgi:high-affinity K+ transport system ATPase subunit B|uniref:Uncharacterized protein n=1 Tax=Brevibacillus parabrevis TaxID=54914 RepID=A0A4Y3PM02_BREPA|nr:high-affinity K+ transport system ATPase subunit B [Brevibacillus sp. 1238]GEB33865.1 hypothetical protein BPA01_34450 [Brevibacillus parabrevis]